MKAYLVTSGVIFGLITFAHLLRVAIENHRLALDPIFILLTMISTALCVWAFTILKRLKS